MRIPLSTYRLQFCPDFRFEHAREILDYLNDLGISHLYASPVFAAKAGSTHGYDVVDMSRINPELGEREEFDRLAEEVRAGGMGWLQDIVPNHQAYDGANEMLMDVFEHGPHSKYYDYFDISWDHTYENIRGRVLAPFLGDFYSHCLERGEIRLIYKPQGFGVRYYELALPIRLDSYHAILTVNLQQLRSRLGSHHRDMIRFSGIINFFDNLDAERALDPEHGQFPLIKRLLWELYEANPLIRSHIDANVEQISGQLADSTSFDLLDRLLSEQYFRLAYWKVGTEELNYRRFFSINHLISLRVEEEKVFDHTHRLVFELIEAGVIHGLRVDHIDGLFDPTRYLRRLRERVSETYIVVEKILSRQENLPDPWPIEGTTGYDFLDHANGVFCQTGHRDLFEKIYREFSGMTTPYEQLVLEKKRMIIGRHMAGDIDNLALLLKQIANRYRYGRDLTMYGLRRALVEILASFPVYRTYLNEENFPAADRQILDGIIRRCLANLPRLSNEIGLIGKYILSDTVNESITREEVLGWRHFMMRLQQYTGPLMAKGVEDTVYYVYNRLASSNEVGSEPDRFGVTLEEFHEFNQRRVECRPNSMNTLATHDTKRGEDTRARLNVLSELPVQWGEAIRRWRRSNYPLKPTAGGRKAPTRNDEYLLYQTLIGAMPFEGPAKDGFSSRIKEYMIKAMREAKLETSWLQPDEAYERAVLVFIDRILGPGPRNHFLPDLLEFQTTVEFFGILNSLSQTLLKFICPGVPDIYQGGELWDFNLVDPDNRRPVDYALRRKLLSEIHEESRADRAGLINRLLARPQDGRIKLFLIHELLAARGKSAELFEKGDYLPLKARGPLKDHVIVFKRRHGHQTAIVVAPRFLSGIVKERSLPPRADIWGDTVLQSGWDDDILMEECFTGVRFSVGGIINLQHILSRFPVALLFGPPI